MKKPLIVIAFIGSWFVGCTYASTPPGWFITGSTASDYDIGTQSGNRHSDDHNAFIRTAKESNGFGSLMQNISAEAYRNKRVRFSGYLKTQGAQKAGLWMRIDGLSRHNEAFDNMDNRALRGDNDWRNYSVVLDVPEDATDIAFGFLLEGKGEVLADDFKLDVVGNDVPTTNLPRPKLAKEPTNMGFSP